VRALTGAGGTVVSVRKTDGHDNGHERSLGMDYAFRAEGLVKRFGDTTALNGVDLAARPGTVLGVLGPNGAGKTTAVRILATLIRPDAGRATVAGFDTVRQPDEVRRRIGLTGQYASVDEDLTGAENLVMIGRLLGLSRAAARDRAGDLLGQFGLAEAAGRRAGTYSGGMRRRLDLAASLVAHPQVVYLDEPTTGLDPARRDEVWAMVRRQVEQGVTVLLTTQYLEEADALADDIAVMNRGAVIAHGTPQELKAVVGGQTLQVRPADPARLADTAALLERVTGQRPASPGRGLFAVPADGDAVLAPVVDRLAAEGIAVTELALRLPSLDEVFYALTGERPADAPAGPAGGPTVPKESIPA
jgi:oleandomycin transport system ATP-binding protein